MPAFLIISAFTGAMNIANDIMAGERERGSLEPLLLNPVSPAELVFESSLPPPHSAWVAFFSPCCVLSSCGSPLRWAAECTRRFCSGCSVTLPLAPLAAAIDLLVCTFARTPKEGTSHLSLALLAPMLTGILAEFFPVRVGALVAATPLLGQQRMLSALTRGETPNATWLLLSWLSSGALAAMTLGVTARLLRSEKVIFCR